MNGKLLKPERLGFTIYPEIGEEDIKEDNFTIYLTDLEDKTNYDIRGVDHPDWDMYWGNEMENVFSPMNFDIEDYKEIEPVLGTITKAKEWLLSIGMREILD